LSLSSGRKHLTTHYVAAPRQDGAQRKPDHHP
jgi:hypothetical protein